MNLLKSDEQRQKQHTYNDKQYFLFIVVLLVTIPQILSLGLTYHLVQPLNKYNTTIPQILSLGLTYHLLQPLNKYNTSPLSAARGRASEKNLIEPVILKMNAATADDEYNDIESSSSSSRNTRRRLYVKVYMEGHAIGRKLDLLVHYGFDDMIRTLQHMFNTNILWGDEVDRVHSCHYDLHVLTYEDEEGDWLIVGDVPWEMFLSAAKRLKITRTFPR